MINNNLAIDSPDRCRHKNVLKVVSGSEFLRSIVMRDILTLILPSFFLECHGLNGFHQYLYCFMSAIILLLCHCIVACLILISFIVFLVLVFVCTILLSAKTIVFVVENVVKLLFYSIFKKMVATG